MPRRQTTVVSCSYNGCKDIAEVKDPNEAPEGWIMVMTATPDAKLGYAYSRAASFEFSSLRCVEKWANARRKFLEAKEIAKPQLERVEPVAQVQLAKPQPTAKRIAPGKRREQVKEAIALLEGETFTANDIAELLGTSYHTIRSILYKMEKGNEVVVVEPSRFLSPKEGGPGKSPTVYREKKE